MHRSPAFTLILAGALLFGGASCAPGDDVQAADTTQHVTGDDATCSRESTCAEARPLDAISGEFRGWGDRIDGQNRAVAAAGKGSTWLSIDVREGQGGIIPEGLGLKVWLYSKLDAEYELYLSRDDCKTPLGSAINEGRVVKVGTFPEQRYAEAQASWADIPLREDGRSLRIEVRRVSGACDSPWGLGVATLR